MRRTQQLWEKEGKKEDQKKDIQTRRDENIEKHKGRNSSTEREGYKRKKKKRRRKKEAKQKDL